MGRDESNSIEDRIRALEQRDTMYSPVVLGGPCRLCGRPNHMPLNCEQAQEENNAAIKRIVDKIRSQHQKEKSMSFAFEFSAESPAEAAAIIEKQTAPACVKEFVTAAVNALTGPVSIKAQGHLLSHPGDYKVSSANIDVRPITFSRP